MYSLIVYRQFLHRPGNFIVLGFVFDDCVFYYATTHYYTQHSANEKKICRMDCEAADLAAFISLITTFLFIEESRIVKVFQLSLFAFCKFLLVKKYCFSFC